MALTLITGRAVAGKTGVLHAALIEAARCNRTAILLLPSYGDVRRARAELASRVPIGIEIATLDHWAAGLWKRFGAGERIVTEPVRRAILAGMAEHQFKATNPLATTGGYQALLAGLAARTAGFPLPGASRAADRLLLEEVRAYRARCTAQQLIEAGEAFVLLGRDCPMTGAVVAVNRFTDLSTAQQALLEGLAARNDVLLSLNWDEASSATEASTALVGRLRDNGAVARRVESPAAVGELAQLEKELFNPINPMERTGAIRFMTAAGDEAECALIAETAAGLVQQGTAPHHIAVVFRDVSRRSFLLQAALRARGLECEVDMAVRAEHTPLGRALTALVLLLEGGGGREVLLSFLLGPYSGADPEDVERFDAWARTNRIDSVPALFKRAAELGTGCRRVLSAVQQLKAAMLDERGAGAWKQLLDALVDNGLQRAGRPDSELALDGSVHGLVVSTAGELARVTGGSLDATDLLTHVAGAKAHNGGLERPGAVYVTEAHRLRSRRFSAVVVGGLTAQEFSSEKPEPLVVQVLQRLGLPAGTEERLSERLLFYSVVTRAREQLVLVRQSSTSAGQELRASVFWDEVGDLYRSAEDAEQGLSALELSDSLPLSHLERAAPAFSEGRSELRARITAGDVPAAEPKRGVIRPHALGCSDREFSVTELETYHSCPYRWFYDRVIRPREIDAAFEARERGALVHEVLAEFYRRLPENLGPRVLPEHVVGAKDLLDVIWTELAPKYDRTTRGLAEQLSLARGYEWAWTAVTQDTTLLPDFVPSAVEWRFGSEHSHPFALDAVALKGSIDRLDANGRRMVVTDYKSSAGIEGQAKWEQHGQLQVVVYAEAVRQILNAEVAGGFYRSLPGGGLRGFWNVDVAEPEGWVHEKDHVTDDAYRDIVQSARDAVAGAAEGIGRGIIAPNPRFKDSCSWCGAKIFCGEALA